MDIDRNLPRTWVISLQEFNDLNDHMAPHPRGQFHAARCSIPQHHFQMPNSGKSNILPAFCQGSKIVTRFQEPLLFFFGFFSFSSPSVASPLGSATSCGGACDTWTLELCGKLTVPWGRNSASVRRPRQIQAMVTWVFFPRETV